MAADSTAAATSSTAQADAALGFDIEELLAPVSEENPSGEDLRQTTVKGKSMLMAEIEEKRKAILSGVNENTEPDQFVDEAALAQQRRSGWREVEKMLIAAFAQGKELSAAVSFAQAAVVSHGWGAVEPCLRFIRLIQERFGDDLYPRAEMDDQGNPDFIDRLVLLDRLDHINFLPLAIRQLPVTDPRGGVDLSWSDFRRLEIMKEASPAKDEKPEQAEARRQLIETTAKTLNDAVAKSNLAHCEALLNTIRAAQTELAALRAFVDQRYPVHPSSDVKPTFLNTAEALDDCENLAMQLVRKKGGGQNPKDAEEKGGAGIGEGGPAGPSASSDQEAVMLLERALAWFRVHQRHNPAAYLVEEAIRWTRMPIASWYLEASEDPNIAGFVSKLMRKGAEVSE
jgi:type VI secretion system protein ImpA